MTEGDTGRSQGRGAPQRPDCREPTEHWRWRWRMAERIAAALDPERHGVVACYLIGSTKHACARAESDLDLVIHVRATDRQRRRLEAFLQAWSRWLGIVNSLTHGVDTPALLDAHLVTDEDLRIRSSFAAHIDSVEDPARPLPVGAP